jgi:hypothetical protein
MALIFCEHCGGTFVDTSLLWLYGGDYDCEVCGYPIFIGSEPRPVGEDETTDRRPEGN